MRAKPIVQAFRWATTLVVLCFPLLGRQTAAQGQTSRARPLALTAEQKEKLKERDRLVPQVLKLRSDGKLDEAIRLIEKVMALEKVIFGEEHEEVIGSLNALGRTHLDRLDPNRPLADRLASTGAIAAARRAFTEALKMSVKVHGETHAATAQNYELLAHLCVMEGKQADAEVLLRKALASYIGLGQGHLETGTSPSANCWNSLGVTLSNQGKHAEAERFLRQGLAYSERVRGQEHPTTATAYQNLSVNLRYQGKYAEAESLARKALAISLKAPGAGEGQQGVAQLRVAQSYVIVVQHLGAEGKYAEAEPFARKTLALCVQVLGAQHPGTVLGYGALASNLSGQGRFAEAEPLIRKVLAIEGGQTGGPNMCGIYKDLASNLHGLGAYAEAEEIASTAGQLFTQARLFATFRGLERAGFSSVQSPFPLQATLQARNGKPGPAWQNLETDLARGLLDELSARQARKLNSEERQEGETIQGQLALVETQLSRALAGKKTPAEADRLLRERDRLVLQLVRFQAGLEQKYGPATGQVYTLDKIQAQLARDAALIGWVDIGGHAKAKDPNGEHWGVVVRHEGPPLWVKLPAAREGQWGVKDHQLPRNALKVLWNPQTNPGPNLQALYLQRLQPLEKHLNGIRDLIVLPSPAMAGIPVESLGSHFRVSYAPSGTVYAWLQERRKTLPLGTGDLLALGDPAFSAEQLNLAPAKKEDPLTRLLRGETLIPLAGTRREVEAIAGLFTARKARVLKLLGANANGPDVDRLAANNDLARFRYLHLATHGFPDPKGGMNSYLALTPENFALASHDKLSAGHILRTWKLDADLVTLSACQTALGEYQGGEGYVGFAQALFFAGAHTLVLSQWPVDDTATSLLMLRFYQNLLGARDGLKAPLSKGEALREAQTWLRSLRRADVTRLPRSRGLDLEDLEKRMPAGDRPYAHPYYWAAFILIGDPGSAPEKAR
jgi:CHAT domain-containing protein/tetratricopeptide (TPR) repeat protein